MKCDLCKKEFEEAEIDESHDVPCYLFEGNRKGRKNQADKYGRHYLCRECHKLYEESLRKYLLHESKIYVYLFFKKDDTKTKRI